MKFLYRELSETVLLAALEVHEALGTGFLEKVYAEALEYELGLRKVEYQREVCVPVEYKGQPVGKYKADFIVDGKIILELKAISCLAPIHLEQVRHYLVATGFQLAILLNFGTDPLEHTRIVKDYWDRMTKYSGA
ncbi:MAG: GxxExxY protein [Acidobacteriota bacterium]